MGGCDGGACRADKPRRRNVMKPDGFDEAGHPQRLHEGAPGHLIARGSLGGFVIGAAGTHTTGDGQGANQSDKQQGKQQMPGFHGGRRMTTNGIRHRKGPNGWVGAYNRPLEEDR